MTRKVAVVLTVLVLVFFAVSVQAEEDIGETLRKLIVNALEANQMEDQEAALAMIHTGSPVYEKIQGRIPLIFSSFDLEYELLYFQYLGRDGEYAVARIKQTTKKVKGPEFQDNKVDLIQVFRLEKGQWKFWNQVVLDMQLSGE